MKPPFKLLYIILIAFLLSLSLAVGAQVTTSQNFLMSNTVKQPGAFTESAVNGLPVATQGKIQSITYFDGVSRPIQNVSTQGSASQLDIVTGIEYDQYGREVKKYLPYADQSSTSSGGYKDRWSVSQPGFYNGGLPNVDIDNSPYTVSVLESSPANRLQAQGAPGFDWQPNTADAYDPSRHVSQIQYLLNKADDKVRTFFVDSSGNITSVAYYPDGQLNYKMSKDEQGQMVKEFTDKSGHVVLKRVMILTDSLQTYYLYDNLGLLRAVIQPEGTVALQAASWVFPSGFSAKWMFLYRYDDRNRMVMKKVPGADSVNMIYDQWDRLVLTQDGNLRAAHNFLFTKYDQLNRPVVTGQITDARMLSAVITDVSASANRFETVSTSATEGYTLNSCFPSSASYTLTVYSTTHYDSYTNLPSWSSGYAFVNEYSVSPQNNYLNGQVVATQVRVLGTANFNRTVTYYDDKYRVIQTTSDNAAGGKDRLTKILSFDGKVTSDYHSHTSRFYTTAVVVKQTYSYDPMDRLLNVTHQTGSQEVVTIAQNSYNELGQMLNKKIQQSPSHPNALQKLDYYYNIRGWITGINRPANFETGYEENDMFNMEMHYNANLSIAQSTPEYNGNIAEIEWKGGYDENVRGYTYAYDQANRMLASTYASGSASGGVVNFSFTKKYNESGIVYDHNGNFNSMTRYHGDWGTIDSLSYQNYSGNQLGRVDDLSGSTSTVGFQDKTSGTGFDYTYDLNGNLVSDYNKSITSITYNYLNLPQVVSITAKGTITYTYDALGNKLQKTTLDQTITPNKTTNYYYAGDFVYRNDTLEFTSHPEGRLRPVRIDTTQAISIANLKYIYDYFLKDHLGSVRSILTTEQQTDIYAATMETAAAAKEDALFSNVTATSASKPSGFTNDNNNAKVSKLNGNINISGNKRVGPSIILKVMAGDTISVSSLCWYSGAAQPPATGVTAISTELIPLLINGVTAGGGNKGGAIPAGTSSPLLTTALTNFLSNNQPYVNTRPKSFLNWMVVDEEFAGVSSPNHMSAMQVPTFNAGDTNKQMIGLYRMVIRRNGWIYIYLSNESNQDVFFDNLVVNLVHGPLIEQKDYYAFGLEIPGFCTQALKQKYIENRKKFENQEYNNDLGLDYYEFKWRDHDPQIGRFIQIDPLSSKYEYNSTYAFCENKVTSYKELEGLEAYADWRVEKDLSDVQSGKITSEQLDQRLQIRGKSDAVAVVVGLVVNEFGAGLLKIAKSSNEESDAARGEIDQKITQDNKSIRSLEKNIREHIKKLDEFKKDPEKNSNPELLKGKTADQLKKMYEGRVNKLQKEIQKFKNVIEQKKESIRKLEEQKKQI